MGIADWGLAATAPLINRGGILYGPLEEVSGVGSKARPTLDVCVRRLPYAQMTDNQMDRQ